MHLWTDYEGNTIAGYTLGRLNRSEGRNAFFPTSTPDGQPALLRLTEAHFDEAETMGRWRKVVAVSHPNLQVIKRVGQTTFEGQSLTCCLLEHTDSSLADVLRERTLTVEETKEVAEAVSGALAALHAAELVHEHVDASNVFAAGEVIKLRSDCCRECAGDFEADTPEARNALRKRDVHDLGLLLLRCLGQEWHGTTPAGLPNLLNRIIPGALNGTLTAEDIATTLQPPKPSPIVTAAQPVTVKVEESVATAAPLRMPAVPAASAQVATATPKAPVQQTEAPPIDPPSIGLEGLRLQTRQDVGTESIGADLPDLLDRLKTVPRKVYVGAGAAAAVLGVTIWVAGMINRHDAAPDQAAIAESRPAISQTAVEPPPTPQSARSVPAAGPASQSLLTSGERAGWRVIAYTYKYEQQAKERVIKLQRKHFSLHPQVFTPTGGAPYFVALGNPTDEAAAMDLRNRARRVGLPRDTFARNF